MNERPSELDVPHWAVDRVKNVRSVHQLPAFVTDRMIYARLVETSHTKGMTKRDQMKMLDSLRDEVGTDDA